MALGKSSPVFTSLLSHSQPFVHKLAKRILIQIITNRSLVTIKRSDDRFGIIITTDQFCPENCFILCSSESLHISNLPSFSATI